MRTLYFDIDGTILVRDSGLAKPALADGRLEGAIRGAGVGKLVCVGNFVRVIRTVWTINPGYDGLGALFTLCAGTFKDEGWFRETIGLVADPRLRAAEVEVNTDWWYMDDEAPRYFALAGRTEIFRQEHGKRILQPAPVGEGADVRDWIGRLAPAGL